MLILFIIIRYNKVAIALRKAADSPTIDDPIFLSFKFNMNENDVKLLKQQLVSENKLEIKNYGTILSYKLTTSKSGNIDFSFYNNKLYKLTITFYGTTTKELKEIIHQELCNKKYRYYNDYLSPMYYYIKQNIIITLSYKEIESNISGISNTKITKMEYVNAKTKKEIETTKYHKQQEIIVGNPKDF